MGLPPSTETSISGTSRKFPICLRVSQQILYFLVLFYAFLVHNFRALRMGFDAVLAVMRCIDDMSFYMAAEFMFWWCGVRTVERWMLKDAGDWCKLGRPLACCEDGRVLVLKHVKSGIGCDDVM